MRSYNPFMAENLSYDVTPVPDAPIVPLGTSGSSAQLLREFHAQQDAWQPRTALGRRLKELRAKFVADGGQLLTDEQIEEELRERRGSFSGD
jgi:hypothetical protein